MKVHHFTFLYQEKKIKSLEFSQHLCFFDIIFFYFNFRGLKFFVENKTVKNRQLGGTYAHILLYFGTYVKKN